MPSPSDLPSRAAQWQRVLDSLGRARGCVVIDGGRRLGKSRLLAETVDAARTAGFAVSPAQSLPTTLAGLSDLLDADRDARPLLLAVDDAAVATLLALSTAAVGRIASAARAVVVVTVNTAAAGPALTGALAVPRDHVEHLRLGPLDHASVVALATDMLGAPPGPRLRDLLAASGGNPWLVRELVAGLRDEGGLADGELTATAPLPGRVCAAVQTWVAPLSARAVHLVWIAAAIGRSARVGELAEVLCEGTASLLPALDEALRAGLLVTDRDRVAFPSELVWRVVLDTIPLSVRAGLTADVRAPRPPGQEPAPTRPAAAAEATLTEQERRIACLVASGLTNQQVARRLFLSPHTVNYHLRTIFRKLDIASRVELARFAPIPEPGEEMLAG